MKIRYKAKKGFLVGVLAGHALMLSSLPLFFKDAEDGLKLLSVVSMTLILAFTFGLFLRTYYVLDKEEKALKIYFIFKVRTILLKNITGVEKSDSPISGFRYAINYSDGLLIKEGKYNAVFINPANRDKFLAELDTTKKNHPA